MQLDFEDTALLSWLSAVATSNISHSSIIDLWKIHNTKSVSSSPLCQPMVVLPPRVGWNQAILLLFEGG
jgi:hypothetical protein